MQRPRPRTGRRRGEWSLWRRVVVTVVLSLLLLTVASIGSLRTSGALRAAQVRQTRSLDAAQNDVATLLSSYLDQETGLRGYLVGGQPLFLQPYRQAEAAIVATETRLRGELRQSPGETALLAPVVGAYLAWHDRYALPTLRAIDTGELHQAQAIARTRGGKQRFDQLRGRLLSLRQSLGADQAANEADIVHLQDQLEALLVAALLVLAAGLGVALATTRIKVIRPLDALTAFSRRVAGGDLHADLPICGPGELRGVARDVASMRYGLLEEINRARMAGEALRHDSPTVSALSEALVPRNDQLPDVAAVGRLDPAEGVLAGDWYDLIRRGDELTVVVGDVSGHGPRSAVLALGLRSVINTVLRRGGTPGEALAAAAVHVADDAAEHFATVFVAVLDPAHEELSYASAGHPAAIFHTAGDLTLRDELPPTGPLISPIVALWSWSTRTQRFGPGDAILAYTDGITEGRNAHKEEYGIERLKADLDAAHPYLPADVVNLIASNVNAFVGGSQTDDRTIVYCQRLTATEIAAGPVRIG